jgi:hypothetical protein
MNALKFVFSLPSGTYLSLSIGKRMARSIGYEFVHTIIPNRQQRSDRSSKGQAASTRCISK